MQKQKTKKNIKKEFFEVSAPLTTTKIQLYAAEKKELDGKVINLDLTKNLRGKSLELKLRVKLVDDSLLSEPESIELAKSYILKVMRKGIDYVEDSFELECRDALTRIKPFILTRKRVSRAVLGALRREAKEYLISQLKIRTSQEIFSDLISNKIQKQLSLKLKKIYPLALCEIRVFTILKRKEGFENKKSDKKEIIDIDKPSEFLEEPQFEEEKEAPVQEK